jgi:TetR/AcrR family transcriptional regulator, transcriptional repressor for nem operon
MPTARGDNRTRLIQAAVTMAYRHGFGRTSLADIAQEANVPVGNVYYYFKTKDAIGEAIVEHRLQEFEALQRAWDQASSPKERLCACVQAVLTNKDILASCGCPVGTLCSELHKDDGPLAKKASALFASHLDWIEKQFRALGRGDGARGLAVHLLSALQGVAVLAHSFHDPDLVVIETGRLNKWIGGL